jgi:chromosome segregation ATPase
MTSNENFESNNIIEIIENKLQTFRRKKQLIKEKINNETSEIEQINKNILSLQEKLKITSENIELNTKLLAELDKTIEEVNSGYQNIIESGQCLISLVENTSID